MKVIDNKHWANQKERTTVFGMRFLFAFHQLFGRIPFLLILCPVVFFYWIKESNFRRLSLDYLQRAYREGALTQKPTVWTTYRHLLQFASTILDKIICLSGRNPGMHLSIENEQLINELIETNTGAVILTSHMGCTEALQAYGNQFSNLRIFALIHSKNSEELNRYLRAINPLANIQFLEVSELSPSIAMTLEDEVANGALLFIAGDRIPIESQATVDVNFFGDMASFPIGGIILANLFHCPLLQMTCAHDNSNFLARYKVRFDRLSERVSLTRIKRKTEIKELVDLYAQGLERTIRQSPFDWFNFYEFWKKK